MLQISQIASYPKEPMLLLDTTGSMTERAAHDSNVQRAAVVGQAFSAIVDALAGEDSAGKEEEGGGGVFTVAFAGGRAVVLGDVNPGNMQHVWDGLQWSGSTYIMPGFNAVWNHYQEEFLSKGDDTPPKLILAALTDGELSDEAAFEQALVSHANELFVVIGVVGYGRDHDSAVAAYQRLSRQYTNIAVIPFSSVTDGQAIADKLLAMIQ